MAVPEEPEPAADAPPADAPPEEPAEEAPPETCPRCPDCGRGDHYRCGARWWAAERARWLGREPCDQEDVRRDLPSGAPALPVGRLSEGSTPSTPRSLSARQQASLAEAERTNLRGVLGAVEAPYPALRRPMPLSLTVRCAAELWNDDAGASPSPVARMAEAARAGSQELMEKTAAMGSNIAKWGHGLISGLTTPRSCEASPQTADRDSKGGYSRSRTCYLGLWDNGKEPGEFHQTHSAGSALCASLRSRGGLPAEGAALHACGLVARRSPRRASAAAVEAALGGQASPGPAPSPVVGER